MYFILVFFENSIHSRNRRQLVTIRFLEKKIAACAAQTCFFISFTSVFVDFFFLDHSGRISTVFLTNLVFM